MRPDTRWPVVTKGLVIPNLLALLMCIDQRQSVIIHDRHVPPRFLVEMRLSTLVQLVKSGEIYYALGVRDEPYIRCSVSPLEGCL